MELRCEPKDQKNQILEKEGWLKKKTTSFFLGWQKRYCVVNDHKFKYYNSINAEKPSAIFNFNHISCHIYVDEMEDGSASKRFR